MRARTLMLLSVLATVGVITGVLAVEAQSTDEAPGTDVVGRQWAPPAAATGRPAAHALDVLRAWDRRRAEAWATGDPGAVRALYVRGSRTGREDVAMVAAYRRRGLRVTTMRRQVLAVRVRSSSPRGMSLMVTDRLAEARVTGTRTRAVLPRSRPATRRIVLRRTSTGWRVAEVYDD
jgi:hypothetical protein